jgi:regulatory protein SWI6
LLQNGSRPTSTDSQLNGEDNPSPAKRLRVDGGLQDFSLSQPTLWPPLRIQPTTAFSNPQQPFNDSPHLSSSIVAANGAASIQSYVDAQKTRFSSKPLITRPGQHAMHYKDGRRVAIMAAICQRDDPGPVLALIREISSDPSNGDSALRPEVDTILDDQGHTALHLAASLARLDIVNMLINSGADVHRGNSLGETPLIRACIATHTADQQCFGQLLRILRASIRTLDTSKKSVLHHIVSLAGVKGRAVAARYYLDEVFLHVAKEEGGDFRSIVDLQDEHGDTALNIAARVGNRSLVRILLDVGANRILPNKLGLRPGDFGVETEVQFKPFFCFSCSARKS